MQLCIWFFGWPSAICPAAKCQHTAPRTIHCQRCTRIIGKKLTWNRAQTKTMDRKQCCNLHRVRSLNFCCSNGGTNYFFSAPERWVSQCKNARARKSTLASFFKTFSNREEGGRGIEQTITCIVSFTPFLPTLERITLYTKYMSWPPHSLNIPIAYDIPVTWSSCMLLSTDAEFIDQKHLSRSIRCRVMHSLS